MADLHEGELEMELEDEFHEGELESEEESESEGWLGTVGNVVGSLLGESEEETEAESAFEAEEELEGEEELEDESSLEGEGWLGTIGNVVGSLLGEGEEELEDESAFESEEESEEFFGSIGLISGFLTRLAGLGILSNMFVAIAMVHHRFGFFMNWTGLQKGEGYEYHLLVLAIAIYLIIRGAGAASVDRLLSSRPSTKATVQVAR